MNIISGNIVDVVARRIFTGEVVIERGIIQEIREKPLESRLYILPGFTDSHVHIESSLLVPSEFARLAVVHGTVCTVSDPHEIANVLGIKGVEFMVENGSKVSFRFVFGAPSCVPATPFETAGAKLNVADIESLFDIFQLKYLSEMMNFPGVINAQPEVIAKISAARKRKLPIDGHAPGLKGKDLKAYASAGISTDHECETLPEALEKAALGMHILIREGNAARNFDELLPLLKIHPQKVMFCSDDLHPDHLVEGHINLLAARAVKAGYDLFDVLAACTLNPTLHYKTGTGLLQPGDPADFIVTDDLQNLSILQTWIAGQLVADQGKSLIQSISVEAPNNFRAEKVCHDDLLLVSKGGRMRVIEIYDGQIYTGAKDIEAPPAGTIFQPDPSQDLSLLAVVNRYEPAKPTLCPVTGSRMKEGALASSVAHDSHNIIALGTNMEEMAKAINLIVENRGGLAWVNKENYDVLPLPVAGLMTTEDGYQTAQAYRKINHLAQRIAPGLSAPFMTLSFLALPVIPRLKLTDKGLFYVDEFQYFDNFFTNI
ncbi:MAG: adenine deaminase [Bacteroidales bacterium]